MDDFHWISQIALMYVEFHYCNSFAIRPSYEYFGSNSRNHMYIAEYYQTLCHNLFINLRYVYWKFLFLTCNIGRVVHALIVYSIFKFAPALEVADDLQEILI